MADTSFFFTNIPPGHEEKELWNIFQRWGRVLDVFIPKKLNSRKQHFGFVRFHGVRDVCELKRRLDAIWIGLWKLHVNIARYRKKEQPKEVRNQNRRLEGSKKIWSQKEMHRSFAEVVMSGSASSSQGKKSDGEQKEFKVVIPCFKVEVEPSLWLESCFIGRFSKLSNFLAVKESVVVGGYGSLNLSYLGENFMLLAGDGETSVAKVIDGNKEWFGDIFDSLVPWDNSFSVTGKVAWVRVRGLPLMFWNRQCFELIGALVGSLSRWMRQLRHERPLSLLDYGSRFQRAGVQMW